MPTSRGGNSFIIDDGIIVWFDGPEWDDIAAEVFEQATDQIETYAQDNAPWQDRTGDARAGLRAESTNSAGDITLTLEHTVDYGLWLEVIQNGRFAIIMPTLEAEAPRVFHAATIAVAAARRGRNIS